ncbi:methyltransferase domain-containing protein [Chryseobacterium gambrini]|uniref:Methyltransferase domain-containing protein n=1 Tax=Chryseobacterium gambrini TaxID=373672 RepID=A0AAJ1VLB6_9FLAO|nr:MULTISPECIES: methyltransferase domain-containing protein [Chryseobacterium]MDN4013656.1 methyltransferase domain-containing protein [Chryseobacterium gambrini]MDN4028021.1 methyltransferase domain-containing protein [Chryseobacterium gambrini]QWA39740.1 methyltransferase domain-containing protein [Chryseobacterium sp. ZHDP1]
MPWNPEIYNQFKNIRYQPFFDLSDLIKDEKPMKAIDLGCGTGEQTAILAEKFPEAVFIGIDSSAEMLEQSKSLENERLHFRQATTEEILESEENWDLIFSNAALQWSDNHHKLFPELISKLNCNGQLAIQMPYQPGNILNQILSEMSGEEPFKTQLNGWNRPSSVLTIDEYVQIIFENELENLNIFQKVYPIIAEDHETLFNFISGSALIPYLERLSEDEQETFKTEFKRRIQKNFPKLPAVYSFKRILMYGRKP